MIVSAKTRWFAVTTGFLIGVAGNVVFGRGFALLIASCLVAGAIVQAQFPRIGRVLMCAGALWLSFWVFFIGSLRLSAFRWDPSVGPFDPFMLACVVLMAVCDVLIAIEEVKIWRPAHAATAITQNVPSNP